MNLDDYRQAIDKIDQTIVSAFDERMRIAEGIARYKQENGLPVTDALRERQKLDSLTNLAKDDMAAYTRLLYSTIFEMSKDHQRTVLDGQSPLMIEIEEALEKTPLTFPKKASVACQGIEGAYSQQACDKLFQMPQIVYTKNFQGVFSAIDSGLCSYGVLPLENSTAGSVNQVYDLMMKHNFYIVKSIKLKVDHCLLAKSGTRKEDITEIFSHEQALHQCSEFLKSFPNAKITVWENTAQAAKMVAESPRKDIAALASFNCGQIYGLNVLEGNVQNQDNNYTRFICISKSLQIYPGANKTSLMMILPHKPGSLYNVLSRFYALGINLLKLESRPLPQQEFHFMFYFDIEGEVHSPEFSRLINQLAEMSQSFKYLGSYQEV